MLSRIPGIASLLFVVFGFLLSKSGGHYEPVAIVVVFVLFCFFVVSQFKGEQNELSKTMLMCTTVIFCARLFHRPWILYQVEGLLLKVTNGLILATLVALGVSFLYEICDGKKIRFVIGIKIVAIVIISTVYLLVPLVAPNPLIDVFSTTNLAADYFAQWKNPYTQTYPDIYHGAFDYKPAVAYFPGFLYLFTPVKLLTGDIRFALVFAVWITAWILFKLARSCGKDVNTSLWISLCWLCFPVGLFVVEESFLDPLLTMTSACLIWGLLKKNWVGAGLFLGATMAMKQYGILVLPVVMAWLWGNDKRKEMVKIAGLGVVVFVLACAPFAIHSFNDFYFSTVGQILKQQFRFDSFSLVSLFNNLFKIKIMSGIVSVFFLAMLVLIVGRLITKKLPSLADLLSSLTILYGWIFLWGKQAFVNYYYYFSFFLFVLLIVSSPKFVKGTYFASQRSKP